MRIALDAMGGDNAPAEIVAGALQACELIGDDQIVLVGIEDTILPLLGPAEKWQDRIIVHHASEIVEMDESPVEALRKKRDSSMAVMAKMASTDEVDAVISAGNTGAFVAACQLRMRLMPGVLRPGITVVFPTFSGPIVLCDAGANIAPQPIHLLHYALMNQIYAHDVLGIEKPTVGLISIGQEDAKGNELVKKVNQLLREDDRVDFIGNVEPREFMKRPADVIVCDGFVGNVILKLTEGLAEGLFKTIAMELAQEGPELAAKFQPIVKRLYQKHDYNEYGGAPLMGVDGTCIICHGSSDARAIKNAVLCARKQVNLGINEKIAAAIEKTPVVEQRE